MTNIHHSINYIEFPLTDRERTMAFYAEAFGWAFQQWGEDYLSFTGADVEGGFNGVDDDVAPARPGALVILYSEDLEASLAAVKDAGGRIEKDPYPFPGGRRFHFIDPNGNELAVWSEK